MATISLTATAANNLIAQPNPAGEQIICKSTNSADTMNFTIYGQKADNTYGSETIALNGKFEVQTTTSFKAITYASLASAAIGVVSAQSQGTAAVAVIDSTTNPSDGDTLVIGIVGSTRTYTFKTSPTVADQIVIGGTVILTATNITSAINAGAYGGTANAFLSASSDNAIVTVVDRLACNRAAGWTLTQGTGSSLSLSGFYPGYNGPTLVNILAGGLGAFNQVTLATEDLSTATMLPGFTLTSNSYRLSGKQCTIYLEAAAVSSAITAYYQISSDNSHWHNGVVAIPDLNNSYQAITPSEFGEYIRVVVTNPNAAVVAVNGKLTIQA